jgi:hypothetical protein
MFVKSVEYVDLNDMDNPIKRKIDADSFMFTMIDKFNDMTMFLSKTEYILYDNPFSANEISKQGVYYDVDRVSNTYGDYNSQWYCRISLLMSNKINQSERRVRTFFSLVANIGGFFVILDFGLIIILGYLSAKMYKHSLLNSISKHQVKLHTLTLFIEHSYPKKFT